MPIRILIEAQDGVPGGEPGETRMRVHLQSSHSPDATVRERVLMKYIVDEFQEAQLRYGRTNGAVRTALVRRDAPKQGGGAGT